LTLSVTVSPTKLSGAADSLGALQGGLAALDESSLGKIELTRNGLHPLGAQPGRVPHHRQRIARQRGIGEDINDAVFKFQRFGSWSRMHTSIMEQWNCLRRAGIAENKRFVDRRPRIDYRE
jgi:hypothetical protein